MSGVGVGIWVGKGITVGWADFWKVFKDLPKINPPVPTTTSKITAAEIKIGLNFLAGGVGGGMIGSGWGKTGSESITIIFHSPQENTTSGLLLDKPCQSLLKWRHMDTVNISLTNDQVKLVDNLTKSYQFANRSEFFRAILRLVFRRPEIITAADELILEPPAIRSRKKIIASMKATGQYSSAFLKSLGQGLSESDYFSD